jgi:lipid-binding SYLF domain-containing protein
VDDDAPRNSAENRLVKSAAALRTFRENASGATRMLLDKALCIGVAPRREPGHSAVDAKGFVSCRPSLAGSWSGPAGIAIEGGGTFWAVVGNSIDLILLATNAATAAHFGDRQGVLGSPSLDTIPGPVRLDQIAPRNAYVVILAYQLSATGVGGIDIAGATLSEDRAANTALYGKDLSNAVVLNPKGEGQIPIAAELFMAELSSQTSGESDTAAAEPTESPKSIIRQPKF